MFVNNVEIWIDIEGFEGKYQVSNTGKVRSMNYNNTGKIRELKQKLNKYGYYEVKLSKNNFTKNFLVSTLVGNHFLLNNNHELKIMHIGDTKKNCVSNLKYAYQSEILHKMYKRGSRKIGKPSQNIITYKDKSYKKFSDIAKDYNIDTKNFSKRRNRGWTLDEITSIPVSKQNVGGKPYFYEYYGEKKTVYQISKITGVPSALINKRLSRGWNIYEAAEIIKGEKGK